MSQHVQLYRYRPLRSTVTTRLVLIQPAGSTTAGIAIELIEAFPNGITKYDALSYTWGDKKLNKSVMCKGRRLFVTTILHQALKRFRHPTETVTMWIDQLCIDRDNILERNRQVSLIGRIFQCAQKVVVWLGEDMQAESNSSTKLDLKPGLRLAKQILDMLQDEPELKFKWDCMIDHPGFLPKAGSKAWQALAAVLRRPWFMRMWVIQEVVLSSQIEVVCGRSVFTWEEVGRIVGYLDCQEYRSSSGASTVAELPFNRINRMKEQYGKEETPDLSDLLMRCRRQTSSDPRDKIFALLELGQHETDPDYSKTTKDVYTEFAFTVIRDAQRTRSCCEHALDDPYDMGCCSGGSKDRQRFERITTMLRCAGSINQNQELPTWVPDWSVNLKLQPFDFGGCQEQNSHAYALGELRVSPGASLSLPGKIYDTIKAAGSLHLDLGNVSDPKAERALISRWYAECKAIARENHLPYPANGKPSHTILTKILEKCGVVVLNITRPLSPHEQSIKFSRPSSSYENHLRSSGNLIDDLANSPWILPESHYESKMGVAVGRVLFVTTCGWMGLAPLGTREGDVVFIMLGCNIPFVLRPAEGGFALIGESYTYGIMGEQDNFGKDNAVQDVVII